MPPTCTVCSHAKRKAIDRDLVLGKSVRHIAALYGSTSSTIQRHRECIADQLERVKDQSGLTAHAVLSDLIHELLEMSADVKREAAAAGIKNADRRMFLEVADRVQRSADSFAKVNREVVTSTVHLFAQLGVRDDQELRSLVDLARGAQNLTLDDCELDGVELLRMVLTQRPERRAAIVSALGREASRAEVIESNGHANGDTP